MKRLFTYERFMFLITVFIWTLFGVCSSEVIYAIFPLWYLTVLCPDRLFGSRGRSFWVRQLILGLSAAAIIGNYFRPVVGLKSHAKPATSGVERGIAVRHATNNAGPSFVAGENFKSEWPATNLTNFAASVVIYENSKPGGAQ